MKLKYYLRGMGLGILVTALILGLAGKGETTLTDAQIKEKAAALGMVDSSTLTLAQVQKDPTEEPKPTETPQPAETPQPTEEPKPTETPQPELKPEEATIVEFVIQSGASSGSVSRNLEAVGLVEDADAYDKYLCDNGYSKGLRVGTFKIPADASEEEIAKIITGKR